MTYSKADIDHCDNPTFCLRSRVLVSHKNTMVPAAPLSQNTHSYTSASKKPATIATLAERALENIWDENKELKYFLRIAERSRKEGKEFYKRGDLENAFVSFARAATLVLEKLPTHRDYKRLLSESQRENLMLVCDSLMLSSLTMRIRRVAVILRIFP